MPFSYPANLKLIGGQLYLLWETDGAEQLLEGLKISKRGLNYSLEERLLISLFPLWVALSVLCHAFVM